MAALVGGIMAAMPLATVAPAQEDGPLPKRAPDPKPEMPPSTMTRQQRRAAEKPWKNRGKS